MKLFRHAYDNVPFYRELYRSHGISRNDVRSLADIKKLPVVGKHELRAAARAGGLWQGDEAYELIRTSGSTGAPFEFRVDRRDNRWRKAQYLAPYLLSGRKALDSVLRFVWRPVETRAWYRRFGIFGEVLARANAPVTEQYACLLRMHPEYVQGYPSALRLLACHISDHQLPCPPLKAVFTDSEILTNETRCLVEQAFQTRVIDVFGSYETDNIAFDCQTQRGLHILEDCVFVETGPNPEGELAGVSGELICTVLHNRLTPFIRYNLGDLVRIETGPCGCRNESPRLVVVGGRANDLIALPDGSARNAMSLVQNCRDAISRSVVEFQIHQRSTTNFEFLAVPGPEFGPSDRAGIEAVFARLLPHAETEIRLFDRIERTAAGKFRAFVGMSDDGG